MAPTYLYHNNRGFSAPQYLLIRCVVQPVLVCLAPRRFHCMAICPRQLRGQGPGREF